MTSKTTSKKTSVPKKTSVLPAGFKPQISALNKFSFKPGNRFQSINRGRR